MKKEIETFAKIIEQNYYPFASREVHNELRTLLLEMLTQQRQQFRKEQYSWLSPNGFDNEKGKTVRDFLDKFYKAKEAKEVKRKIS